jgi:hypothetical protein
VALARRTNFPFEKVLGELDTRSSCSIGRVFLTVAKRGEAFGTSSVYFFIHAPGAFSWEDFPE